MKQAPPGPRDQAPAAYRAHGLHGGDQPRLRLAKLPQLAGPGVAAAAGVVAQHAACGFGILRLGIRVTDKGGQAGGPPAQPPKDVYPPATELQQHVSKKVIRQRRACRTPRKAQQTAEVHDRLRGEAGLAEEGRRRPPSQPNGRIPRPREYRSCNSQHRRDGGVAAYLQGAGVAELHVPASVAPLEQQGHQASPHNK